MVRIHRMQSKL